jgi:hypothetical protein
MDLVHGVDRRKRGVSRWRDRSPTGPSRASAVSVAAASSCPGSAVPRHWPLLDDDAVRRGKRPLRRVQCGYGLPDASRLPDGRPRVRRVPYRDRLHAGASVRPRRQPVYAGGVRRRRRVRRETPPRVEPRTEEGTRPFGSQHCPSGWTACASADGTRPSPIGTDRVRPMANLISRARKCPFAGSVCGASWRTLIPPLVKVRTLIALRRRSGNWPPRPPHDRRIPRAGLGNPPWRRCARAWAIRRSHIEGSQTSVGLSTDFS